MLFALMLFGTYSKLSHRKLTFKKPNPIHYLTNIQSILQANSNKTTLNYLLLLKTIGSCHFFPPKLRGGLISQKVQIPLCRHQLR